MRFRKKYETGKFLDKWFLEIAIAILAFEKTFREKPGFIEAVAYDTAIMLFQIVSRPDVKFRSAVKNELVKLSNFQGVTGLTSFDNNGEPQKDLYLLKIKGNKFVELR